MGYSGSWSSDNDTDLAWSRHLHQLDIDRAYAGDFDLLPVRSRDDDAVALEAEGAVLGGTGWTRGSAVAVALFTDPGVRLRNRRAFEGAVVSEGETEVYEARVERHGGAFRGGLRRESFVQLRRWFTFVKGERVRMQHRFPGRALADAEAVGWWARDGNGLLRP